MEFDTELFIRGYTTAALWSTFDEYYSLELAEATKEAFRADCIKFVSENLENLNKYKVHMENPAWSGEEMAGHDFLLTRNRHGIGFWDRGAGEVREKLTEAAHKYLTRCVYLGDDDLVYTVG
jgi:hypothetical protein